MITKKPLARAVTLLMLATVSASIGAASNNQNNSSQANNSGDQQLKTLEDLKTPTPPPSLVQPYMPTSSHGTARFGLNRNKSDSYYHKGIDFSRHGDPYMWFPSDGKIIFKGEDWGRIAHMRPNGDVSAFIHGEDHTSENRAVAGELAMKKSNVNDDGFKSGQVHGHYEYYVPRKSGRQRYLGISGLDPYNRIGKNVAWHRTYGNNSGFAPAGTVVTDPTPYLPNDIHFNLEAKKDPAIIKYFGNTARTQYNVLYNPNPPLPVGVGLKVAVQLPKAQLPNPSIFRDDMSPEEIAALGFGAMAAGTYAGAGGYNIDGQLISQRMLASIFSSANGSDYTSLPETEPVSLQEKTPMEVISDIASHRYGNAAWEDGILKLSSKGLLTEYVMMTAAENFLKQQISRLRNRVELQIATLNQAKLAKFNNKIEALATLATAESVPRIIDRKLDPLPNGYYYNGGAYSYADLPDVSNLPNDLDALIEALMDAISHGESKSYDGFNNGTACDLSIANGSGTGWFKPTQHTPVEILRHYNKNYKLGRQLYHGNQRGGTVPCSQRVFAVGFLQVTPARLSGALRTHPEYANLKFTPDVQRRFGKDVLLMNTYRKPLRNFLRHGGNDYALDRAMRHLAWEWASIAYGGKTAFNDGYNRANSKSTRMVFAILKKIQAYHNGTGGTTTTNNNGNTSNTGTNP